MIIFISNQYLLLDNEFSYFCSYLIIWHKLELSLTLLLNKSFFAIQHILDHIFLRLLGEDSWGILTVMHNREQYNC